MIGVRIQGLEFWFSIVLCVFTIVFKRVYYYCLLICVLDISSVESVFSLWVFVCEMNEMADYKMSENIWKKRNRSISCDFEKSCSSSRLICNQMNTSFNDHVPHIIQFLVVSENMSFKSVHYIRITRRKAKWVGNILHRDCLLKHVIQGKREGWVEVTKKTREATGWL